MIQGFHIYKKQPGFVNFLKLLWTHHLVSKVALNNSEFMDYYYFQNISDIIKKVIWENI